MSSVSIPRQGSFLGSLRTQMRVIGALMMRELHTRYGRENVGYLWMIAEPMLLASVIGVMHFAQTNGGSESGSDIKPVAFAVVGYTTFILFRGIVNRSEGSMEGSASLLYHRQITILDIIISRALIEIGGVFTTFLILMTLLTLIGLSDPPINYLQVIAAWALMFWYCVGHSLVITAISHDNRTVGRLVHPYTYFMVGLSGAFVQIRWLPHPIREIFTWVPMTSIFELERHAWFRSANLDYFYPLYLISSCALLTWVGLVLCSRLRSRVHVA